MKRIFLLLLLSALTTITRAKELPEATFQATPKIEFNREKLAARGIATSAALNTIEKFFQTHDSFTLTELESLKLTSDQGRIVTLGEVATIRVQFDRKDPCAK